MSVNFWTLIDTQINYLFTDIFFWVYTTSLNNQKKSFSLFLVVTIKFSKHVLFPSSSSSSLLFRKNKKKIRKLRVGFNKTFTFRVDIYKDWKSYKTREYRIQTKKKNCIPYSSSKVKYMQRTITRIRSICHPFGNSHKDFVEPLNTIDQKWLCIYLLFFIFVYWNRGNSDFQ